MLVIDVALMGKSLSDVQYETDGLKAKVEKIASEVSSIDARLVQVETRLDSLGGKVDKIAENQVALQHTVQGAVRTAIWMAGVFLTFFGLFLAYVVKLKG